MKARAAKIVPATPFKIRGIVKEFYRSKGHGEIRADTGEKIYVHYIGISGTGYKNLKSGQVVEFNTVDVPITIPRRSHQQTIMRTYPKQAQHVCVLAKNRKVLKVILKNQAKALRPWPGVPVVEVSRG